MNVFAFFKSLDDLLFEVVSWVAFYPLTLWRVFRRPLKMMAWARKEILSRAERRFDDALSPPLLLLATVLLSHLIELALVGQSRLVTESRGIAGLIADDTSLILLRLIAFSSFPLIFAIGMVKARGQHISRRTLEPEFFAQSYGNAPFALIISIASTVVQLPGPIAKIAAVALGLASVVAFLAVETGWLKRQLKWNGARAFLRAFLTYLAALASLVAFSVLLGSGTL